VTVGLTADNAKMREDAEKKGRGGKDAGRRRNSPGVTGHKISSRMRVGRGGRRRKLWGEKRVADQSKSGEGRIDKKKRRETSDRSCALRITWGGGFFGSGGWRGEGRNAQGSPA